MPTYNFKNKKKLVFVKFDIMWNKINSKIKFGKV